MSLQPSVDPAEPRFSLPPRPDLIDRSLSAATSALLMGAWVAASVTVARVDPAPARHVAALQVRP